MRLRAGLIIAFVCFVAACGGGDDGEGAAPAPKRTTTTTTDECGPGDATCSKCEGGRQWVVGEGCILTADSPVTTDNPAPDSDSTEACTNLYKYENDAIVGSDGSTPNITYLAAAEFFLSYSPGWQAAYNAAPTDSSVGTRKLWMLSTFVPWCKGHDLYHA